MNIWLLHSRRWGGRLWLLLAVLMVILALLVGGLRASLPHLNHYRSDILHWLEQQYQLQLEVAELQAGWHQFGLDLTFKQVRLKQSEQAMVKLQQGDIALRLDLLQSLFSGQLQFDEVKLSQAKLVYNPQHRFSGGRSNPQVGDVLRRLLLERFSEVTLSDSQLLVESDDYQLPPIQIDKLSWMNHKQRHQGVGTMHFNALPGQYFDFILNFSDDPRAPDQFNGKLFVEAGNVEFHTYLAPFVAEQVELRSSQLNFYGWLAFNQQGIEQIDLQLGDNQLAWQDSRNHSLALTHGGLTARPVADGWQVVSQQLAAVLDGEQNFPLALSYRYQPSRSQLQLQSLPMRLFYPLLELFQGRLPLPLSGPELTGSIENLVLDLQPQAQWQLWFDLNGLGWPQHEWLPGVPQLNAHIDTQAAQGYARVDMAEQIIDSTDYFSEPLLLESLDAVLSWRKTDSSWLLQADKLTLGLHDLALEAAGQLNFPLAEDAEDSEAPPSQPSPLPQLSLYAELALADAASAQYYLPQKRIKHTAAYLTQAIKGGVAEQGQLLWHGQLNAFPFKQRQGIFQARLPLQQTRFAFLPTWPELHDMQLDLLFENQGMWFNSSTAKLGDLTVEQVSAAIPHLGAGAELLIDASVARSELALVRQFIADSPLDKPLSGVLNSFDFSGEVDAALDLHIPLYQGGVPAFTGQVNLFEVEGHIPALPEQRIQQLQGQVSFEGSRVFAEGLTAKLWQQPLTISFNTAQQQSHYQADVQLKGEWPVATFQPYLPDWLGSRLAGRVDWQSEIRAKLDDSGVSTEVALSSELLGVSSDFPAPFNKSDKQAWSSTAHASIDSAGNLQLLANVADKIQINTQLPRQGAKQLWIGLGQTPAIDRLNSDGRLDIQLPQLVFADWWSVVKQITTPGDKSSGLAIRDIHLNVDKLDLWSVPLSDVQMMASSTSHAWLADLSSKEAEANLTLDRLANRWDFRAKRIELPAFWQTEASHNQLAKAPESDSDAAISGLDPSGLPGIDLLCLKCTVGPYHLGELRLDLQPAAQANGLVATEGWMRLPDGEFNLSAASWLMQDDGVHTQLKGRLKATQASKFVNNIDSRLILPVRKSSIRADIEGEWRGSPFDFRLQNLDAEAKFRLGEGYIPNLSDQGTRVLSVLSLESLQRKLRLDFSDLFDEGLFYSDMEGKVALSAGVARSDINMDGVAGDMQINGSSDLLAKSLDYKVVFTPDITASLPVLGFITTADPITGLAVYALSEVLSPVVDVITGVEFSVTGTTAEPVIKEVKKTRQEFEVRPYRGSPVAPANEAPSKGAAPPTMLDNKLSGPVKAS